MLTFQLSFHLPFYALRTFRNPCERPNDRRRFSNGDILRRCRDLSFLNQSRTEASEYLYQAQISCVITGPDRWRWVAYCFVDVYYETEGKETVSQYYEDSMGEDGLRTDPLTLGCVDADTPIRDPREYFLKVFWIRLNQVRREWQRVVERLSQEVRAYEEVCWPLLLHLDLRLSPGRSLKWSLSMSFASISGLPIKRHIECETCCLLRLSISTDVSTRTLCQI